ncbi:MAG: hypothetical protein RL483_1302 [Pseudomonadota bacterium]|jgi:hypothetical protein
MSDADQNPDFKPDPSLDSADPAMPTPRPISFWFLVASGVLLLLSLIWMGSVGSQIASKSTALSEVAPKLPAFEQYARLAKLTGLTPTPLERGTTEPEPIRGTSASDSLGAIFASFAAFENTRSEGRLKLIRPVVSGVEMDSPAYRAGVRIGDEIAAVGATDIGSVYDFMLRIGDANDKSVAIVLRRQGRLFNANLSVADEQVITAQNHGLMFATPRGLNVVSRLEALRLAEKFDRDFIQGVSSSWRGVYIDSLGRLAAQLGRYNLSQRELKADDAGFVSVANFLMWHHDQFQRAIDNYLADLQTATVSQAQVLSMLGDAVMGLVAALIFFFLSLWFHFRRAAREAEVAAS